MNTERKPNTALLMQTEGNPAGDNFYFILRPVTYNGTVRNPDSGTSLDDLELRAHWNPGDPGYWSAWPMEYRQVFSVDIAHATIMLTELKRIHRHLDRLEARFGYAPDFATLSVRFADAIGARIVLRQRTGRVESFYDDNEYSTFPASHLPELIREAAPSA